MQTDELAYEVTRRLLKAYGKPVWQVSIHPLDLLINTILSQNTNDRNRDLAYQRMRNEFTTWEEVRDADLEKVVDSIRPAGLANQKGRRIQELLRQISNERGSLNLDFLQSFTAEEAKAWLLKFVGVGPKTASIVLLFSLGFPAFPVDTHIYRVSGRLGLRPESMSVEDAHQHLARLIPPEEYGPAHINLIRLGRETCHPHKPACSNCPVNELCMYRSGMLVY
jgi:endonuclease III